MGQRRARLPTLRAEAVGPRMCWRDDHASPIRAPLLDPTQDRLKGLRVAAGAPADTRYMNVYA